MGRMLIISNGGAERKPYLTERKPYLTERPFKLDYEQRTYDT